MKEKLENIWLSEYFINGNKYFQLYNYNFFRIIEKKEYYELNPNEIHPDKQIFAVADATNGDREHSAYLYFDNQNEIFIQSNYNWIEPIIIKKIATNIEQLFGERDFSEVLIKEKDKDFWEWYENIFHSSEIEKSVPKGVLPDIDLRFLFKETIQGTFLSDHKEINTKAFIKYFVDFGVDNLNYEELFSGRPMTENIKKFVDEVNLQLNDIVFYSLSFNPSGFWGIGNFNLLTADQKKILYNYGLAN